MYKQVEAFNQSLEMLYTVCTHCVHAGVQVTRCAR